MQAAILKQSGQTDFQVSEEIQELLNQAEHWDAVAEQKDGQPRQQALQLIDKLEREASDCRQLVKYNQTVLARQQQELEDVKVAAVKMVQDAEARMECTQQIIAEKVTQLAELEG